MAVAQDDDFLFGNYQVATLVNKNCKKILERISRAMPVKAPIIISLASPVLAVSPWLIIYWIPP